MAIRHLEITGRVQGVGYRDGLRQEARKQGVRGWVRNRADGSVEALLEGPEEALAALLAWARRGPVSAQVDLVRVSQPDAPADLPAGFETRPTL